MKLFGTDGIRGKAGQAPLVPETVARVGAALVKTMIANDPSHRLRYVIGRDTRESGTWIEAELARGLASEGASVVSAGVVPTPAVAYLASSRRHIIRTKTTASRSLAAPAPSSPSSSRRLSRRRWRINRGRSRRSLAASSTTRAIWATITAGIFSRS